MNSSNGTRLIYADTNAGEYCLNEHLSDTEWRKMWKEHRTYDVRLGLLHAGLPVFDLPKLASVGGKGMHERLTEYAWRVNFYLSVSDLSLAEKLGFDRKLAHKARKILALNFFKPCIKGFAGMNDFLSFITYFRLLENHPHISYHITSWLTDTHVYVGATGCNHGIKPSNVWQSNSPEDEIICEFLEAYFLILVREVSLMSILDNAQSFSNKFKDLRTLRHHDALLIALFVLNPAGIFKWGAYMDRSMIFHLTSFYKDREKDLLVLGRVANGVSYAHSLEDFLKERGMPV